MIPNPLRKKLLSLLGILWLLGAAAGVQAEQATHLFSQHCAQCHGVQRLGGIGPALLPENLSRTRRSEAQQVISQGRPGTQMPGFTATLSGAEIEQLLGLIYTPLPQAPQWDEDAIRASHVVQAVTGKPVGKPVYKADPLKLIVAVEHGDHHASLIDGDRFDVIHRWPTRFALRGSPKFSPDGRFVYFTSRDGWISKFDLYSLQLVAEIRAGISSRNAALSADGRHVMVANYLPHTLVVLDAADLSLRRLIEVRDDEGVSSRVSAVYTAAPRQSFIAALQDIAEVWEISYDPEARPVYQGMVHDHRMGEGVPVPGPFAPRRIKLETRLDDFFFDADYLLLMGAAEASGAAEVIDLDARRRLARLELGGQPRPGSGVSWARGEQNLLAISNPKQGVVSVIDMDSWQLVKQIETLGPGFFIATHPDSPYLWADVFFGPHRDAVHVIDKTSLEIVKTLRPSPGQTAAHVEFSRDGKYALLSVWAAEGAIVVYDSHSLEEVKRLPMKQPSGKYNIHTKLGSGE